MSYQPMALTSVLFWTKLNTVATFCPGFLLVMLSVAIITGIVQSKQKLGKLSNPSDQKAPPAKTDWNNKKVGDRSREISLTVTLIFMNLTFIICNFPVCIFMYSDHIQTAIGSGEVGEPIKNLLVMFAYTDNSLNFLLYCITGARFRNELKQAFMSVCT